MGEKVEMALKGDGYVPDMIHTFKQNNIVEILEVSVRDGVYKVKDYLGHSWWIYEKDIIKVIQEDKCSFFIS